MSAASCMIDLPSCPSFLSFPPMWLHVRPQSCCLPTEGNRVVFSSHALSYLRPPAIKKEARAKVTLPSLFLSLPQDEEYEGEKYEGDVAWQLQLESLMEKGVYFLSWLHVSKSGAWKRSFFSRIGMWLSGREMLPSPPPLHLKPSLFLWMKKKKGR